MLQKDFNITSAGYIHFSPIKLGILSAGILLGAASMLAFAAWGNAFALIGAILLWSVSGCAALLILPTPFDDVLPNDSIQDARETLRELVDVAVYNIDMMGQRCDDMVFTGEPDLVQAIQRAMARNVRFRLLYSEYNIQNQEISSLLKSENVELYQKENIRAPHFAIVDGRHVRSEKYHDSDNRSNPKATNIFHSLFLAHVKSKIFAKELEQAKRINL